MREQVKRGRAGAADEQKFHGNARWIAEELARRQRLVDGSRFKTSLVRKVCLWSRSKKQTTAFYKPEHKGAITCGPQEAGGSQQPFDQVVDRPTQTNQNKVANRKITTRPTSSKTCATPKSASLATPSLVSSTFSGFRSRWTTWLPCKNSCTT